MRRLRNKSIFLAFSTTASSPCPFVILTFASAVLMIISFSKVYTARYAAYLFIHLKCFFLFFPPKNHNKMQDDSSNLPSRLLLTEFRSLVVSRPRQTSQLTGNTSYEGKKNFKLFKKVGVYLKWSQDGTI